MNVGGPGVRDEIRVFNGMAGFKAIRDAWQALALRHGTHFLHFPGWYHAGLAVMADTSQVYFVTVTDSLNGLQAVLPLEKTGLRKGRVEMPVLQLFYPDEMGVNDILSVVDLAGQESTILRVLRRDAGYFALVRWQCVLQSGCAVRRLLYGKPVRITHASKYIEFAEGADKFWAGYSSKFRKNLQKKLRKAEQAGALRLVCTTAEPALPAAFETFLQIEDSGWKGEQGTSIRRQPAKLAYFEALMQQFGQTGQVQINILYLDDIAIAAQFGLRIGNRLYLLKIGFSERHAAISPGYLILYRLVESLAASGTICAISFVTGVDWIDRWHPQSDPVGIAYSDNGSVGSKLLLKLVQRYAQRRDARVVPPVASADADD